MSEPHDDDLHQERRSRAGLRGLIEEMMTQLRQAVRADAWTAEERTRAEADLARIMEQVRGEAFGGRGGGSTS